VIEIVLRLPQQRRLGPDDVVHLLKEALSLPLVRYRVRHEVSERQVIVPRLDQKHTLLAAQVALDNPQPLGHAIAVVVDEREPLDNVHLLGRAVLSPCPGWLERMSAPSVDSVGCACPAHRRPSGASRPPRGRSPAQSSRSGSPGSGGHRLGTSRQASRVALNQEVFGWECLNAELSGADDATKRDVVDEGHWKCGTAL
jgi:hypothetical protein